MIEYPKKTVGAINDTYTFPDALGRQLVLSNPGAAAVLVKLTLTETLVDDANFDVVVPATSNVVINDISVQVISVATTTPLGVFRYV